MFYGARTPKYISRISFNNNYIFDTDISYRGSGNDRTIFELITPS